MATGKQFLSLLLACAIASACASAANSSLEAFLAPYLYAGESAAQMNATALNISSGTFLLVKVNGNEAFLVSQNGTGAAASYSFVNNSDAIYRILREHYSRASEPAQSELDSLLSLVKSYNASRQPREEECKESTGLDRPGAVCDVERCEACMSVPFCNDKIPYFGNDFLHSISYFQRDTNAINAAVTGAVDAITDVKNGGDAAALLPFVSANLSSASTAQASLATNHVFGCYSISGSANAPIGLEWCAYRAGFRTETQWCKDIAFNATAMSSAAAKATGFAARVVSNASAHARADALAAGMRSRAEYLSRAMENATFAAFYSSVQARADASTLNARKVLQNVSDAQVEKDIARLSELMLGLSQRGLDRNYSAANATGLAVGVLAAKIDAETSALASAYGVVLAANDSASEAIFNAGLVLDSQDAALAARLAGCESEQAAIARALASGGPFNATGIAEFAGDLGEVRGEALGIAAEKSGSEARQAGSWIGGAARVVSVPLLDRFASLAFIPSDAREGYARAIPTAIVVLLGAGFYFGVAAMFAVMWRSGRIRLTRVAAFLWAAIFLFLLVVVGMTAATANGVVQREAGNSAYSVFSASLSSSTTASIVVVSDGTDAQALASIRSCGSRLAGNLTALGKNVYSYQMSNGTCTFANGTATDPDACKGNSSSTPTFVLSGGNTTGVAFHAFYAKRADVSGNASFYGSCLVAGAFAPQSSS